MPLYFFDITNGKPFRDGEGTECADDAEMRRMARQTIPDVAREEIPRDGERQFFTIIVRNEAGTPVYTATLSYAGTDLTTRP